MPGRDPPHPAPRTGHRGGSDHSTSLSPARRGLSASAHPVTVPSPCRCRPIAPLLTRSSSVTTIASPQPARPARLPAGKHNLPEPLLHRVIHTQCCRHQPKGALSIPLAAAEKALLPAQGAAV